MQRRLLTWAGVLSIASSLLAASAAGQAPAPRTAAPVRPEDLPAKTRLAAPKSTKGWTPPRTAWGDPEIAGVFTNSDESGIPFERPAQFDGRRVEDVTPAELADIVRQRQQQTVERAPTLSEFPGATSPLHWFENYNAANSRAGWSRIRRTERFRRSPPKAQSATPRRAALRAQRPRPRRFVGRPQPLRPLHHARDSRLDDAGHLRQLVPDSPGPGLRRDSLRDGQRGARDSARRPPAPRRDDSASIMGDARGHWDGNTLVVETTNFTDKTAYRGSSEYLKMIERFKPVAPDIVEWSVTFDDPHTWAAALDLRDEPDQKGHTASSRSSTRATRATTG